MNYNEIIKRHFDPSAMNADIYEQIQKLCIDVKIETYKQIGVSPLEVDQYKKSLPLALKLIKWINFLLKATIAMLVALIFTIAISLSNKAKAQPLAKKGPLSHVIWDDDAKHYWAGFCIASITTHVVYEQTNSYGKAFLAGFALANIAGWGKEWFWDGYLRKGVKSVVDGGMTSYGGLCGAGVTDAIHHFKETRRAEEIEHSKHLMD